MKNRYLMLKMCLIVVALFFVLMCGVAAAGETRKPNVLFIITDQQRIDDMSCAGNPWVKTPALDSLAARGTRFSKSYCVNPLCVPSRASISTSRMPHEIEAVDKGYQLPTSIPSLGMLLKSAGYRAAWAGKWHVRPTFAAPGTDQIPGFEVLTNTALSKGDYGVPEPSNGKGLATDAGWADAAIAFLREKQTKPFFLTLSLLNPHDVCELVGEQTLKKRPYPKSLPELPKNFDAKTLVRVPGSGKHSERGVQEGWEDISFRRYLHNYYRFTQSIDGLIGKVLDALKDAGLEDNTIVIFTSDHGEMGGSHHILLKTQPYEEALMVPFVIAGPGIPSGATDDKHFISGLDILPTVCDFAGIEAPKESLGMSVRKILASPSAPWRDAVYASVGTGVMMRLVRTEQYKYILLNRPNDREVLFDLASDPGETKNVVNDAALKDVLARHRKLLTDWMAKTNDPFPRF